MNFHRCQATSGTSQILYEMYTFLECKDLLQMEMTCFTMKRTIDAWAVFRELLLRERGLDDECLPKATPIGWKLYYKNFYKEFQLRVADKFTSLSCRVLWRCELEDLLQRARFQVVHGSITKHFLQVSRGFEFGPIDCCRRAVSTHQSVPPSAELQPDHPRASRFQHVFQRLRALSLALNNLKASKEGTLKCSLAERRVCHCTDAPQLTWRIAITGFTPDCCKVAVQTGHCLLANLRLAVLGRRHGDPPVWSANVNHHFTQAHAGVDDEVRFAIPGLAARLRRQRDLCLQLDLTVLPPPPHHLGSLVDLLRHPHVANITKSVALLHFKGCVTDDTAVSSKVLTQLQGSCHLPRLISVLEESPQLVPTTLVALAGIFDTPSLAVPPATLAALLHTLLPLLDAHLDRSPARSDGLDIPYVHAAKTVEGRRRALAGEREAFAAHPAELGPPGPQRHLAAVAYGYGVLFNVAKQPEGRAALLRHPAVLPMALDTLAAPAHYHAHFSALHLLALLRHHGQLPRPYHSLLALYLEGYIAYFPKVESHQQLFSHWGLALSARDLADVSVPLLASASLDCVRLGAFVFQLFYTLRPS
eukprot:EG_transcript_2344